jgi:hypothetical protein
MNTDCIENTASDSYIVAWVIHRRDARVEAGLNTFTAALRDVGGNEKLTPCLGVYLGHPVPTGYKYGTWPSGLGESQIWKTVM